MKYAPTLNDEGKMITNSREKDFEAKAEGDTDNISKFNKAPSSSRQWSAFKNPRIVRVSRAFGGKDRHSKVCTVKGLRDRRIRLSVPTAIQLYDLQDRLGLSQPSKVVDWLLDATKHDIDKLPPLQIPPGSFTQFHHQNLVSPHHELNAPQSSLSTFFNPNPEFSKEGGITQSLLPNKEGIKINYNLGEDQLMGKSNAGTEGKLKEVERETIVDKTKWMRSNEEQSYIPQVSAQNFFPIASNLSSFPYNYYHFDPSSLSLSQFGHHGFPQSQTEGANASNLMSMPSLLSLPSGSQLFLSPPVATPPVFPTFPSYISNPGENDTRQINHFPFLSSSSHQQSLPNPLMSSHHNSFSSQNDETQPDKGSSGS